ncbi:MAG: arnC [Acidimicrobiales bacterium]|nr:arnC [Acidimicrobiales bacterium]
MRTMVVIPTYQEAENVVRFLTAVRSAVPDAHILVADDDSPDGTGQLAEKAAAELGQIEVLHRASKEGLGAAYRQGFRKAVDDGYDPVIQMDCDFSHDPEALHGLLAAVEAGADCAIGSRYVPGGATPSWPLHRRMLSRYGNRYTAALLELGIHDATSGFRAYRAETLEKIQFDTTKANGYAFQSELAYRMVQADLDLVEVPITFVDRQYGTSKMSARIISESMALVTAWGLRARARRLRQRFARTR